MQIVKVDSSKLFRAFLDVPKHIYTDDPEYVPHIRQEIQRILWDNKMHNEVGLWLLFNNNQAVGRIAAFVNKGNKGGLGFFECVNNQEGAHQLFDIGIQWLQSKGLPIVEAPVNCGERDKFWGLMVKGFKKPSYQENYNPPYYEDFFKSFGFEIMIRQSTQEISPDRFNAWKQHEHFVALSKEKVLKLMKSLKPVMREDLIWFTYDKDKPVAFYVSIIEVNEIFKYLNGNLNWFGKLKFLYFKSRIPITKIRGLVFGVVPTHQGLGITSGMMMKVFELFKTDKHLKTSELAWIGDFNPRMLQLLDSIGAVEIKQHITYQKKI